MTYVDFESLPGNKQALERLLGRSIWRTFRALPLRDRSILRLLYYRGASQGELAGALGISRKSLRRTLHRILARASDPMTLALLAAWNDLDPAEQRLAYLHRILGMSLREIVRYGLVPGPEGDGRSNGTACMNTVRKKLRAIDRKIRRRLATEPADASSPTDAYQPPQTGAGEPDYVDPSAAFSAAGAG